MTFFRVINSLWRRLNRRPAGEELDEEIQSHLQIEIDQNVEDGMTPEAARYAAQRKFGNAVLYKELAEDVWRFAWLDSLLRDIRYAIRAFRNAPGFALTVIGTLALGLGALAASYSVFNTMVLRPYAVRDPYSLYSFTSWESGRGESSSYHKYSFTWHEFLDFRQENPVFSEVVGHQNGLIPVAGKRANIQAVTGNYFATLGGRICKGRSLLDRDDESGRGVAVASYAAWKGRLGADSGIVGAKVRFGAEPVEIVGVACPEFTGPQIQKIDFWVSLPLSRELVGDVGVRGLGNLVGRPTDNPRLRIMGRLKPGLTKASAETALLAYGKNHYLTWRDWSRPPDRANIQQQATIIPLDSQSVGFFVPFFLLFGLVLLIACANISNMMLARGLARRRELGIRMSLGAGRARMVRQLLTESLLLAFPAALAAFGIAYVNIRIVYWMLSKILPGFMMEFIISDFNLPNFSPDLRVFAFLLATTVITALIFGLMPAIQTTRFRSSNRGEFEGGYRPGRLRSTLVVVQATLCTLLLILSAVAMRNQMRTASLDLKVDTRGVFLIETYEKYRKPVLDRLSSLSGAELIGTCASPPLYYPSSYHPKIVGDAGKIGITCATNWVSRDYFDIYKIAVRGRKYSSKLTDFSNGPPDGTEVVVSETAARRLWPSGEALGQTIEDKHVDEKSGKTVISRYPIVGVAADSVYELVDLTRFPAPEHQAVVYFLGLPIEKNAILGSIIVRMEGNPDASRVLLQKALEPVTPGETHFTIASARDEWDANRWPYLALAAITGFLGALALLMTMAGVFGMLSYVITQRRREFGIRIALGADKARVAGIVLRQSLRLAVAGSLLGSLLAFCVTRVLASQFYLFSAGGYLTGLLIVVAASLVASWIPVRKAVNLDLARTLHCD